MDIVSSGILTPNIEVLGVNGLDIGSEAGDTWYYIWVIADSTLVNPKPVASLLSLSSTSPTMMPLGYDKKRLIGAVRNDGSSHFYDYYTTSTGKDRLFLWREEKSVLNVLDGGTSSAWMDLNLSEFVPPISTLAYINTLFRGSNNDDYVEFRPEGSVLIETAYRTHGNRRGANNTFFIETGTTGIIQYKVNDGTGVDNADVDMLGFIINL